MTLAEDPVAEASFSSVFAAALQGVPCRVIGLGTDADQLPVAEWTREADLDDLRVLDQCVGPTLDIGCGPGRMAGALADRGHVVLGIDVVHEAVGQTRERGVTALLRNVFDDVPGEGTWHTALLADGNVGIGGDPVALLRRVGEILDPTGRVVVELAAPGVPAVDTWARLEAGGTLSRPFRWSVLGVDDVHVVATRSGLRVVDVVPVGDDRWVGILSARR